MNKLLVTSEYTEPSFYSTEVLKTLESLSSTNSYGLLLITKNIEGCTKIWTKAKELNIPTVIHITITGLGGSELEPRVPHWTKTTTALSLLTTVVKNLKTIVLRIDPLIPEISNFEVIEQIVKASSSFGITRCRTSVIDYYRLPLVNRSRVLEEALK